MRGGCSCAGTYGHYLLNVGLGLSQTMTDKIDRGDQSAKPGWVRLSVHPMTTDAELDFMVNAVREVAQHGYAWGDDYRYDPMTNEWQSREPERLPDVAQWFVI